MELGGDIEHGGEGGKGGMSVDVSKPAMASSSAPWELSSRSWSRGVCLRRRASSSAAITSCIIRRAGSILCATGLYQSVNTILRPYKKKRAVWPLFNPPVFFVFGCLVKPPVFFVFVALSCEGV